jgi:hypothetical protein
MPAAAAITLAAYILVTIGSCLRGDVLFVLGVPLTCAGLIVAWSSAVRTQWLRREWPIAWVALALSSLAATGLAAPPTGGAWWYEAAIRAYFGLAIVLIGVFAGAGARGRRRATMVLVAGAVALQLMAPFAVRAVVDVWSWTETCTRALLHGVHPYTVVAPDLQRGGFDFGSTPAVYPYMPLTLLASAPWVALAGDYRIGLACCLPATIALMRAAGRRLAIDGGIVDVITLALVLHPQAHAITTVGYMEPLLVTIAAAFLLFAITAPSGYAEAVAFLLLPAIKQYAAAPAVLYVAMRGRVRTVAAAAAIAAGTVAPFLIWNGRATIDGVLFFMRAPMTLRLDSDSVAAVAAMLTGVEAPRSLAVVTQFVAAALVYPRLKNRGLAGLLLASAISVLASFLAATQAFTNYYYFAGALLLFSALAAAREPVHA